MDTATLSCSVALLKEETLLSEMTLNIKKTHSERLMPLIDNLLSESEREREELGAVAASAGPGSFTGLRIGISTARGLAQGLGIPAVPVCTLEAMAEALPTPGALVCPLLDARRSQVYTALFCRDELEPYNLKTLIEPRAMALSELTGALKESTGPVVFTGEGLQSYEVQLKEALGSRAVLLPAPFRLCRAALVALRGRALLEKNPQASYLELLPSYLRRPEAERLAAEKEGGAES
ncbi:MAG: tRNA (adenosine(37)-N6)-threonylcarbamoyltransferase complex dimerization subunit type 1 TsaB [Bacillota bacterium]